MKKYIATLAALCCIAYFCVAQDFINHLQKKEQGSGTVSVKQSEDISNLVNGGKKEQKQEAKKASERQENTMQRTESKPATGKQEQARQSTERRTERPTTREEERRDKERREKEREQRELIRAQKIQEAEAQAVTNPQGGDKKLMSNSKRVTGYRVQVFAGGNTREDRAKASEVGEKLKAQIPGQPIYVHFYSPRWCCRCGNFLNQEEATKMMKKLNKLGYKSACVVKTTITVSRSTILKSGL
ncbi:MAG: SPOR domain-containing protein [Prevotella sp.]|nr:SPOR domain-containing protein [Prevotella sp.]